jgi:hypothetical protein
MTVATIIYYSGYHPYTLKPVFTPKSKKEKQDQNRFFFWYKKENQNWIKDVLINLNRKDILNKLIPQNRKSSAKSNKR